MFMAIPTVTERYMAHRKRMMETQAGATRRVVDVRGRNAIRPTPTDGVGAVGPQRATAISSPRTASMAPRRPRPQRLIRMRGTRALKQGLYDIMDILQSQLTELGTCIEVGCFAGESSECFAARFRRVICIDPHIPYPNDRAGTPFQMKQAKEQLQRVVDRNHNLHHISLPSLPAAELLGNASRYYDPKYDLIYIDAAHDYENVKKDIHAWYPWTRFLAGHDYAQRFPGVRQAVDEFKATLEGKKETTDTAMLSRKGFSIGDFPERKLHRFSDGSWLLDIR